VLDGEGILEGPAGAGGLDGRGWRERAGGSARAQDRCLDGDPLGRALDNGNVEAKPGTGHSRSPLNKHEQWLLDLVAAEPDLTLDDIRVRLSRVKKLKVGTTSIWRFFDRHEITFKKNSARRRAGSA